MTTRHPRLTAKAAQRLTTSAEPWLSCEDCFDQIDRYVDGLLAGSERISAELRAHLIGCSACSEEARSLITLAADDRGIGRRQALRRFRSALAAPAAGSGDLSDRDRISRGRRADDRDATDDRTQSP